MYTSVKLSRVDLHNIIKAAIEKETGKQVVNVNIKLGTRWANSKEMFVEYIEVDLGEKLYET